MKIEEMGKTLVIVKSIALGECFKENGHIYMKIDGDPMGDDNVVCVNISFGTLIEFASDYYVEPVTAKVVIE